jgi:nitrogen fixation NifU-like protein
MNDDLESLYSEIVMEHGSSPRNKRELPERTHHAEGNNPMCGDAVEVSLAIVDNEIRDIAFDGQGCAFCMASTSLMTEQVKGKSAEFAKELSDNFCEHMLNNCPIAAKGMSENEELGPLMMVKRVPMRIKCVTLCWRALQAALGKDQDPAG